MPPTSPENKPVTQSPAQQSANADTARVSPRPIVPPAVTPNQAKPLVPTMTTTSAIPRPPVEEEYYAADELDDSIVAQPMVMPDFTHLKPANKQVEFRWVNFKAGDGLRYHQCRAMGFVNAEAVDVQDATVSPYITEGGSKFINGDLILMKINRNKYLGAKKFKHQVAASLADPGIQKTLSAKTAVATLREAGAAREQFRGKISVFAPNAADVEGTPLADKMSEGEISRLGGSRDIGR